MLRQWGWGHGVAQAWSTRCILMLREAESTEKLHLHTKYRHHQDTTLARVGEYPSTNA